MPRLVGHIDNISAFVIRGWAAESDRDEYSQTELFVKIDGETICKINDFNFRSDVKTAGFGDGVFGFEIYISHHSIATKTGRLTITDCRGDKLLMPSEGTDLDLSMLKPPVTSVQPTYSSMNLGHNVAQGANVKAAKKVAIFVTYVRSGRLFNHHNQQIRELKSAGYFVIVVHVSAKQSNSFQDAFAGDVFLQKKNIGYDFGSWWHGAQWLSQNYPGYYDKIDSMILVNDSYFGAVSAENISDMEQSNADIAGVCDSNERISHLQSFFLMIGADFLRSGAFSKWLDGYGFPENKDDVIVAGELGLGALAKEFGLKTFALAPIDQLMGTWFETLSGKIDREIALLKSFGIRSRSVHSKVEASFIDYFRHVEHGLTLNPSHFFWAEIIDAGVSLVKRELLLLNPANVHNYLSVADTTFHRGIISLENFNEFMVHERDAHAQLTPMLRHFWPD